MSERPLNACFSPSYQMHVVPEDAQEMLVIKEEAPEQQSAQELMMIKEEAPEEQSSHVDQLDPLHLTIKEEEEDLWTGLEGEQLNAKNETDATRFPFTPVTIKNEDEEEQPVPSQLHQHQVDVQEFPTISSDDQMEAVTDGEDCEGPYINWGPDLKTYEEDSNSSWTDDDSVDDEEEEDGINPDSQLKHLSDSGSKSDDNDKDWKESWASESGVNTFSCSECGEQFTHSQSLQRHMTCHSQRK
ncbi:glutamic acid-rich protein [Nematolebias whitei]|uniref:glutamic acid-rich protein n=1 Tax=Nematolebias whitei TaxID=451745 RepID=UPI00189A45EC|nr:glutamic acid-rich protein [Nematolebias whitei]